MLVRHTGARRVAAVLALIAVTAAPTGARAVTSSTPLFSHTAYVKASNTGVNDQFGHAVAIDGDTMVVGATYEDSNATGVNGDSANDSEINSGAAYVFTRNGGTWSQQAYLKSSNTGGNDGYGSTVAIDGNTVVVGAPYEDSASAGVGGNQSDNAAVNAGAAYVYSRIGSVWTPQAYLKASNPSIDDNFATSIAVSGDTIVVGADGEDSSSIGVNNDQTNDTASNSGAAYVFTRAGGTWSQQAYIKASNPETYDRFGSAVDISGDSIIVGASGEDSSSTGANGNSANNSAENAGAAFVFTRSGGTWTQQSYLKASNTQAHDSFGHAVAVDGDTAVVSATYEDSNATGINGASSDNSASASGAAYVFARSGSNWFQQAYLKASNTGADDLFGYSTALSGDHLVIGAYGESSDGTGVNSAGTDNTASEAGAAYLFTRSAGTWALEGYLKASNTGHTNFFGDSVGVSSGIIVVGAPAEDSNATGVNGDEANDLSYDAGAAYVIGPSCASAPFPDVPISHQFCPEVEWMSQTGVSTGFGDGTFKPSTAVTRQAMSAFLARFEGVTLSSCGEFGPFDDVLPDHPFCPEILWMRGAAISTGYDDNTYRPALHVTRQAMSAFLARVAGITPPACTTAPFSDVSTGHPFCKEIAWMKETGISIGFGDGTYRPDASVTRQAMSAFLYRLRVLDT